MIRYRLASRIDTMQSQCFRSYFHFYCYFFPTTCSVLFQYCYLNTKQTPVDLSYELRLYFIHFLQYSQVFVL